MCTRPVNRKVGINLGIIITNYLLLNWYLYEYFFDGDPFWKGLLYIQSALVLIWFVVDIWRGWDTTEHFLTCVMYLISLAGMFLLFGLSMLYLVKYHPIAYILLFGIATWNIGLYNLLRGAMKIFKH